MTLIYVDTNTYIHIYTLKQWEEEKLRDKKIMMWVINKKKSGI